MVIGGYILLWVGLIMGVAGDVMFLTVAYRRNLWWFFGCLFIPIIWILFFLMNVKATLKPTCLSLLGLFLAVLGGWMAGITWPR
jgi:hypothetical protein